MEIRLADFHPTQDSRSKGGSRFIDPPSVVGLAVLVDIKTISTLHRGSAFPQIEQFFPIGKNSPSAAGMHVIFPDWENQQAKAVRGSINRDYRGNGALFTIRRTSPQTNFETGSANMSPPATREQNMSLKSKNSDM